MYQQPTKMRKLLYSEKSATFFPKMKQLKTDCVKPQIKIHFHNDSIWLVYSPQTSHQIQILLKSLKLFYKFMQIR